MEPVNFYWPKENFLDKIKKITHENGALLIFDEICSGFHLGLGGAQKLFSVKPDLATFGKAMGNGYPISCIVGKKEYMKIFEDAFFSFTFAGDLSSIAAAIKVLDILENTDAFSRMTSAGTKLFNGAMVMAKIAGLENNFKLDGHPHWCTFSFVDDLGREDPETKALWIQEVTRHGVLILTTFNISASLTYEDVEKILLAFAHAFKVVANVKKNNYSPLKFLSGEMPVPAFKVR